MGAFANQVALIPGWWAVNTVENAFYQYIGDAIDDEGSALRNSPATSKERGFYEYVFGKDSVKDKKTAIELGVVACLIAKARTDLDQVDTHVLTVLQRDRQIRAKMQILLDDLDHYADQIKNIGALKIKATMSELVFRGDWTTTDTNAIPPAATVMCNPYKLKHFGSDSKAACYIGHNQYAVKAMEEKAKDLGISIAGGAMFRFNANLGWDGEGGTRTTANTTSIRVDSIGTDQHSHPLAEEGSTHPSFRSYVVLEIIAAARTRDAERLLEIAKFITLCGGTAKEFAPPGKLKADWKKAQEEGMPLPACKFW
jgi:hypothetical protein